MVDMGRDAIARRLRQAAQLLAARGFTAKGVDMSPRAVSARLEVLGSLSDMCRRLAKVGESLRPGRSG